MKVINRKYGLLRAAGGIFLRAGFLFLFAGLLGCQKQPTAILEPQFILTPTQLSGPALGRELPILAWRYQLPEESPHTRYHIRLELRRAELPPESICEFTPEYLSNQSGRDLVVTVTRPGTYGSDTLADTQFQLRLLDSSGEATAIVVYNNNCQDSHFRALLNGEFRMTPEQVRTPSNSEVRLWETIDKEGNVTGEVFLIAARK